MPVDWEIPVFITTKEGEAFVTVTPAHYLLSIQRKALATVLNNFGPEVEGKWRLPKEWVERKTKTPKMPEPEQCMYWGKPKTKIEMKRDAPTGQNAERQEFLNAFYANTGMGNSRAEVELWWHAFMTFAANWMLLDRKPVDMFFIKLHPSPYRANWKAILLHRFPNLGRLICRTRAEKRDILMSESGLLDAMISLDLLAYNDKEKHCQLRVEVEHRPSWWKLVKKSETARMLQFKPYGYASRFMDFVKRSLPTTSRLYTLWLSEIARPTVATDEGLEASRFEFMANDGRNEAFPRCHEPYPTDCIVPNKLPIHSGFSSARDLFETYAVMPEVSDIQPPYENVWNVGSNVYGPENGQGQTSGLPVPSAGEKPNAS